jgi:DhnA family fructose-bisphosphate aldolase class Ia
VNDSIVRLLAGIGAATRPIFLKMPYFRPAALEQLVSYDSSLVVGILGGSAGTTFDAFHMLWEAKKYGARAALFGRKINNAENQLAFVAQLRALADGNTEPAEAVRAYHAELEQLNITPHRPLKEDLTASPTPA